MTNKLFVYGTLGPGRPNEHILKNIGGSWMKASVTGTLHDEGWGAAMGFPGITLEGDDKVDGFVFSSDRLEKHWPELDAFEGDAYERVSAHVMLEDGSVVEAFIYTLSRPDGDRRGP